jgi:hypothetical protein
MQLTCADIMPFALTYTVKPADPTHLQRRADLDSNTPSPSDGIYGSSSDGGNRVISSANSSAGGASSGGFFAVRYLF